MKQYLSPEQTAKLIELGFEIPFRNEYLHIVEEYGYAVNKERNFTIGELIEMLPMTITHEIWFGEDKGKEGVWWLQIDTSGTEYSWDISYVREHSAPLYLEGRSELIDALYDMIVKLKEEKVL